MNPNVCCEYAMNEEVMNIFRSVVAKGAETGPLPSPLAKHLPGEDFFLHAEPKEQL
jgi:hypothetical protein